ncbi:hypothetical protein L7F22_029417 [Adiantum nelumboides]|nr:hypothetical protein [Adiantum nelumboides]
MVVSALLPKTELLTLTTARREQTLLVEDAVREESVAVELEEDRTLVRQLHLPTEALGQVSLEKLHNVQIGPRLAQDDLGPRFAKEAEVLHADHALREAESASEAILAAQEVCALIVVTNMSDKGGHAVLFVPASLTIASQFTIPGNDIAHNMGIRKPVGQVTTVVFVVTRFPPAELDAITVLPSAIRLKVARVRRVDVVRVRRNRPRFARRSSKLIRSRYINNIAKLLYIHMLGYPAHFGQIECLKLVATPRFTDKRLGYLGIMLLLDENTEVLTLVTNGLKNDMAHSNMYVVGLALCTFANIASEEMSRDLSNEVERLMGSSNTYIRRKAAICAMRIVRKVPDLLENFTERTKQLLNDKNHGVLLCGVTLAYDICRSDPTALDDFRRVSDLTSRLYIIQSLTRISQHVPLLVRHLKALVTTGYSPEHDVSGITDPFLQVKILRLLRLLGRDNAAASEAMNDVLAQVATNTEASKNVGNSILYETVLTILEIEAENGLRVMAINILGKFLGNRDNNIRYVALNTLNKVVSMDTNAVQRHRNIIIDCLRDGDISIRRRALELSYALINESNVRVLTRELLAFLEVADNEFKLGLTTQICLAAEKFAPNRRWHIDTELRVLKLAGNYVREEVLSAFLRLVCHTPELQAYTTQKLFSALHADFSQESLTLAAVWVLGEFGEILLEGGSFEDEELVREVSAKDVVDLLASVLDSPYVNSHIRQWDLTSLAKLTTRIRDGSQQNRIESILSGYDTSVDVEIQQRAVEFRALLARKDLRDGVLEPMPPPEIRQTVVGTVSEKRAVGSTRTDKDALLDLMGDEAPGPSNGNSSLGAAAGGGSSAQNTQDLLADIFGGMDTQDSTPAELELEVQG